MALAVGGASFEGTSSNSASWRRGVEALAIVSLVIALGQAFGLGLEYYAARWFPNANPLFLRLIGPGAVAAYELVLFWLIVGWYARGDRASALGLVSAKLSILGWIGVVIGLYVLKAVMFLAGAQLTGTAPQLLPAASGAALAPFVTLMKSNLWVWLIGAGLLAAVVEELIYRGFLSRILEGTALGFWGGATISALIWAGMHFYYPALMQGVLFALGLALSFIRAKTGSVYPGMLWHAVNNTVALLAMRMMA